MPRLLPRLLKSCSAPKHVALSQHVRPRKRKSLYRPIPLAWPSFHPAGRTRSMLLDQNPVTDKRAFARHKRLPPRVHLGPRPGEREELDPPREMTVQEREWWSSPYLRMLASPLRKCMVSKRLVPNEFLVRLAVLRLPSTQNPRSELVLVPDGLEHPKYKRRKARVAIYVTCWKDVVQTMKSPGSHPCYSSHFLISKHLCSHIGYLLRLRVFQELEVLLDALSRNQNSVEFDAGADPTILRRLTRSEFKAFRETGIIPYPDAVAVLVVPPVNRDPGTNLRPPPSQEPVIPSSETSTSADAVHDKTLPPLSSLHHMYAPDIVLEHEVDDSSAPPFSALMTNARVPLYNGLTMFPSPPHRAAFHELLSKLLNVERRFRRSHPLKMRATNVVELKRAKGEAKGSHAFLLLSNERTAKRADTAALAIALWRLRMWEGDAFCDDKAEGWEIGKKNRIEQLNRLVDFM